MTSRRSSIIGDRKREKEEHLQGSFELPEPSKKKKDDGFTTVRVSNDSMSVIDDVYFEKRFKKKADAVDYIIAAYLEAANKK